MKLVTAAVLRREATILLARRAPKESLAGMWEFPGGKVHPGESVEECLARELREELTIECTIGQRVADSEYHYAHGSFRILAYEAQIDSGEITLSVHDRVEWVRVDKLLQYELAPADIPIAAKLQALASACGQGGATC